MYKPSTTVPKRTTNSTNTTNKEPNNTNSSSTANSSIDLQFLQLILDSNKDSKQKLPLQQKQIHENRAVHDYQKKTSIQDLKSQNVSTPSSTSTNNRASILSKTGKDTTAQPRQVKRPDSSSRYAGANIVNKAKKISPQKGLKKSDSGINQFSTSSLNRSPHLSRIIRNNDISNELALSQDITFDQELLDQHRNRAALTIQRWFKQKIEDRLLQEADSAIKQTKELLRMKKERLVKNYVQGRESVDDPYALFKEETSKESFSLFGNNANSNIPRSIYGNDRILENKIDNGFERRQPENLRDYHKSENQRPKNLSKQFEVLDQSAASEIDIDRQNSKSVKQQEEEDNKLKELNDMLKNKDLIFSLQDDDEVEEFMRKFYQKKNNQHTTDNKRQDQQKPYKQVKFQDDSSSHSSPGDRKNAALKHEENNQSPPFNSDHSKIMYNKNDLNNENEQNTIISDRKYYEEEKYIHQEICDQINKVISGSPESLISHNTNPIITNNLKNQVDEFKVSDYQNKNTSNPQKQPKEETALNNRYQDIMKFLEVEEDSISQRSVSKYSQQKSYQQQPPSTSTQNYNKYEMIAGNNKLNKQQHQQSKYSNTYDDIDEIISQATQSNKNTTQNRLTSNNSNITSQLVPDEYKEKLMELEIEREEQQKALKMLKEIREKEKQDLNKKILEEKEIGTKSAEEVKVQMTHKIEKQLQLIEQLVKDKEGMQNQMKEVAKRLKEKDQETEKEKLDLIDKFKRELKKEKEAWMASEKVRKEKWEYEKIQEIKMGTVQQLQPTIEQLIIKNKDELRKQEERNQIELRKQKEQVNQEWEKKLEQFREKSVREREDALEKERDKSQQKMHDQYERLEQQFNEERKRWKEASTQEYDRLDNLRRKDKESLEEQLRTVKERYEKELDREKLKFEDKLEEQQRRLQVELKQQKEQLRVQQDEWKDEFLRKQHDQNKEYLTRMAEQLKREQQQAVEKIIDKLSEEQQKDHHNIQKITETKTKEVELKWKQEIQEYKSLVQQWKEKYNAEQYSKQKLDDNLSVLTKRFYDMELEITSLKEKLANSEKDRNSLVDKLNSIYREQQQLRNEVEDDLRLQIDEKERELRKMREEVMTIEHRHKGEQERDKLNHKNQIDLIHSKVEQVLAKKRDEIAALEQDLKMKDIQIEKLKVMLDKQRKELLK
ncbi:UNKNOWN [Stylonychia lemnae]|uniref:Uncharacterized protein n=1 Tax=Stylonychia lemnae TaxID=5949 RepID=A0A078AZA7_STYLE|nr:UNKNOWN [Stylonychia lemnae]|eukprot:CDW86542.1 UNKNOWN [Stylonychia lemnae]